MRDRETDSWWSLMGSRAIGGALEGTKLRELPLGEKTTWGEWRARHPESSVLSVDGTEHVDGNPYDAYFSDEKTFRGVALQDHRLTAKAPVYAFRIDGKPYAVPHERVEGGRVVSVDGRRFLFHRPAGAPIFRSTVAYLLPALESSDDAGELRAQIESAGLAGARHLDGFDTFWYTWVSVNPTTELILP